MSPLELKEEPGRWEPPPAERKWFRHSQTADRGYAVRRQGKEAIRFDRGAHIDQVSFDLQLWQPDNAKTAQFSAIQIAQVCFEADKKLCWAMGLPDLAKREWADMTEKRRLLWVNEGPQIRDAGYERRERLYRAIQAELAAE